MYDMSCKNGLVSASQAIGWLAISFIIIYIFFFYIVVERIIYQCAICSWPNIYLLIKKQTEYVSDEEIDCVHAVRVTLVIIAIVRLIERSRE